MGKKLTEYEQKGFFEISQAIGTDNNGWHTIDEIRGVPIPEKDKPLWMKLLVDKGYYASRKSRAKTEYQITRIGLELFNKLRIKAERAAQPIPFRYPDEFKVKKSSFY